MDDIIFIIITVKGGGGLGGFKHHLQRGGVTLFHRPVSLVA